MFVQRQKRFVNFTTETNRRFIGQNWQVEMWNYAQNSSSFKDGSQVQGHIWSEIFANGVSRNVLLKYVIED